MKNCLFCRLIDSVDKEWESEHFYVIFDLSPVTPGHLVIIPKRHIVGFGDLNDIEWRELKRVIDRSVLYIEESDLRGHYEKVLKRGEMSEKNKYFLKKAVEEVDIFGKPGGYNIGVNDGRVAGRTVDHLHIHIIPRYEGDSSEVVGGVRQVIKGRGDYRKRRSGS